MTLTLPHELSLIIAEYMGPAKMFNYLIRAYPNTDIDEDALCFLSKVTELISPELRAARGCFESL